MKILQICAFLVFFCCSHILIASSPVKVQQFINHKDWNFVENIGQLADQSEIKYYGHQGGVHLYCKPGMLSFVFTKVENSQLQISEATSQPSGFPLPKGAGGFGRENNQPTKISTARTDLVLLNSNPNAQILATDQQEYYENYYTTGDADHGITNVHTFKTVTYKNIYPNIDMILNCRDEGVEYSFIVHPEGKVSNIQIKWNGAEATKSLANGGFKFSNSLGTLKESAPKSFVEGKVVGSWFEKEGFKVGKYDKWKDLVIDPYLDWATYFGGSSSDAVQAIALDASGNVYLTSATESNSGIATSGAYQTSFAGNQDVFLAKFSSSGSLTWATYYGGNGADIGSGISIVTTGEVYISGVTNSNSGIASVGGYQTSFGGGTYNAFLAKFSNTGYLSWGTYYGGTSYDQALGVGTDATGNIYITGFTESSGIATSGAYQTSLEGSNDAFLAKFSSTGNIFWATYYGGNGDDYGWGISVGTLGNVYITGYTSSSSGIATKGAYQTSYGDSSDAFLANFSSSGSLIWATYYGGNKEDEGYGVSTDASGNIYLTGNTTSSSGIATSGAYQTYYGGGTYTGDAFLAKFTSGGNLSWATYYGGSKDERGYGVSSDAFGDIYITGQTASSNGITTSGAYQTSFADSTDAFLANFSSSGSLLWATYYGGSGYDNGYGIGTDAFGNVYITGYTDSKNGIATSGACQTAYNGGGNGNAFLAKFNGSLSGISTTVYTDLYGLTIYPNPFIDKTLINFTLPQTSHVKISIMDLKGNVLFILADKILNSGLNKIGINASEASLSPGTYVVNIMIGGQETNRKIVELR